MMPDHGSSMLRSALSRDASPRPSASSASAPPPSPRERALSLRWNGRTVSDVQSLEQERSSSSADKRAGDAVKAVGAVKRSSPRQRAGIPRSNSAAVRAVYAQQMKQVMATLSGGTRSPSPDGGTRPRSPNESTMFRQVVASAPLQIALHGPQMWREWYTPSEDASLDASESLALHWATSEGMHHLIGTLLRRGGKFESYDACGRTPLTLGAFAGQVEAVETLLDYGVPVNYGDAQLRTPLQMAAAAGSMPMIELLLRHDADAEVKSNYGHTAAMIAAGGGHAEALRALFQSSNWDYIAMQTDNVQMDPLLWCCRAGEAGAHCLELLLEHGALPSRADFRGRTALGWAAVGGHALTVERLCEAGANVTSAEWSGMLAGAAPLLLAAFCGHSECMEVLLKRGGDPTVRCFDGSCALTALALGSQGSKGNARSHAAFEQAVRVIVPALLQALGSGDKLVDWLAKSGISPEEIEQLLNNADGHATELEVAEPADAMLSRMETLLAQADLVAWADRRATPPISNVQAAIMIQKHSRKYTAVKYMAGQHSAATRIQRHYKGYQRKLMDIVKESKELVFYGPETEPAEHYFQRVGARRGIDDLKVTTIELTDLMVQWASLDKEILLRALRRWQRNVSCKELERRRERYSKVIAERTEQLHSNRQVRFAGMKLRHSLVLRHEHQQMVGIKLDLLNDQLDDQTRQVYELQDIQQSIAHCRQSLNNFYNENGLEERPKTQTLVQYAGADVMEDGLHLEHRPLLNDEGKDFSKTERDALKCSDTSIISRTVMYSETQIARGQQLVSDGEYVAARAAFEAGYKASARVSVFAKMMGDDLEAADLSAQKVAALKLASSQISSTSTLAEHSARTLAKIDGDERMDLSMAEKHKKVTQLWKKVGTRVTINNIIQAEISSRSNQTKSNDLGTRKGLAAELFHLRSTSDHLQILSAFQFRRSAKELVESANASSKDAMKILARNASIRSTSLKEDERTPDVKSVNPFGDGIKHYNMLDATVMIHGLPSRENIDKLEKHALDRQISEMMNAFFGPVLAVTVRKRSMTHSWGVVSFANHESVDRLLKLMNEGLLLTWPPTANSGTILQFAKVDEVRAMGSSGAFGQTWSKQKAAVRIARVATDSFREGGEAWSAKHDGRLLDIKQAEKARLRSLREQYLAELDKLAKIETSIRQVVLDHHEAKIQAVKIGLENAFYYMTILRQIPFFGDSSMSDEDFKDLVTQMDLTKYAAGATIVQEGTVPTACFVLLKGEAFVMKEGLNLNRELEEGAFFGELGLQSNDNRAASIISKTSCKCIRISKDVFRKFQFAGDAAHKDLHKRKIMYATSNQKSNNATTPSRPERPASPSAILSPRDMEEVLQDGDEEDMDADVHVTRASVSAVKAGLKRSRPNITKEEIHAFVHQGIWGPLDEHHTVKKRWSRKLQVHRTENVSGQAVYENDVDVPLAEFMENVRKCVAEEFGAVANNNENDPAESLPKDWVKMTAVQKLDGVPVDVPDDEQERSSTVWIGGLPEATAQNPAEFKNQLAWFGAVQSSTVRVKPGYRKSWALVTFVEWEAAAMVLGHAGKQFRTTHGDKGWDALVFKPSEATKKLASSDQKGGGALASMLAAQGLKNADAGAHAGWRGSPPKSLSQAQRLAAASKSDAVQSRRPADYLVRRQNFTPKPPGTYTPHDAHAHYAESSQKMAAAGAMVDMRLNEFEEEVDYVPGRGFHYPEGTEGCRTVGNGPPKTTVDPPPTRGHPRSSMVFEPKPKRSVLDGTAVVQDGRLRLLDGGEDALDDSAKPPAHARGDWIIGAKAMGWVPKHWGSSMEDPCGDSSEVAAALDVGVQKTTHEHRGVASGMFEVISSKGVAARWHSAFQAGRAAIDTQPRAGTAEASEDSATAPRPPPEARPASAPTSSPRAQKQAAAAAASTGRARPPLSAAPAWKPHSMRSMNAGWRHKHTRHPKAKVKGRAPSPSGVSPPTSPPRHVHYGTRQPQQSMRQNKAPVEQANAAGKPLAFKGWENPAKRF